MTGNPSCDKLERYPSREEVIPISRFILRRVNTGFKFDLKAANGEVILTSEVYLTPAACRAGIASVRRNAPAAPVQDLTAETPAAVPNPRFEVYRDRAEAFRFRLRARNGKIIAVSEAYASRAGCLGGIESVRKNAAEAEFSE